MQSEIIDYYLNYKKSTLIEYAKTFYKVYQVNDKSIWHNEEEYKNLLLKIVNTYVNKYYLRSKEDLTILNINNYSLKEFRLALSLAIIADALDKDYQKYKENNQESIYDLTIIVYLITNIDKIITIRNNNLKTITNELQSLLNDANQSALIKKNPFLINMLAHKIKDSEEKEQKFFDSMLDDESYNEFSKYDDHSYYVSYIYNLRDLNDYSGEDIKKVYQKYHFKESYLPISYFLSSVTILKLFVQGGTVPFFLLPINAKFLNNPKNIEDIKSIFKNVFIKDNIKFSIFYSDYKNNYEKFNILRNMGFKLVLYMDETEQILDYSNIKIDLIIYATSKFLENNDKFEKFVNHENIEYHLVDTSSYINENTLLKENLKEE